MNTSHSDQDAGGMLAATSAHGPRTLVCFPHTEARLQAGDKETRDLADLGLACVLGSRLRCRLTGPWAHFKAARVAGHQSSSMRTGNRSSRAPQSGYPEG